MATHPEKSHPCQDLGQLKGGPFGNIIWTMTLRSLGELRMVHCKKFKTFSWWGGGAIWREQISIGNRATEQKEGMNFIT